MNGWNNSIMIFHVEEIALWSGMQAFCPVAADVSMNMLQLVDLEHRTGGALCACLPVSDVRRLEPKTKAASSFNLEK